MINAPRGYAALPLLFNMLTNINNESGRRNKICIFAARSGAGCKASGFAKTFGHKEIIGFLIIVHIDTDSGIGLWNNRNLNNVHMEAVGILHPVSGKLYVHIFCLVVGLLKSKLLKELKDRLSILGNN